MEENGIIKRTKKERSFCYYDTKFVEISDRQH